jgi:hypothetical protein
MANPLTFLLPFRYDAMRSLLVIQSGPIDLAREIAARLRTLFPGCKIEGLVRDNDVAAVQPGDFDRVTAVRWEDRLQMVRDLRTRKFDAVVVLLSGTGSRSFLLLPYLLRTGAILMFNDHFDYFPLKLGRLTSLAHHVSGAQGGGGAVLRWALGRAIVVPAATVLLLASTARIYWRARRRQLAS